MSKKPNWLEQNPVDWYNHNKLKDAIKILSSKDETLVLDGDFIVSRVGKKNQTQILKIVEGHFEVLTENSLGLVVDLKYSPFQIFTRFSYNNNFKGAFNYVGVTYMDMEFSYVRVGIRYYKVVHKVDRYGISREELVMWNKEEIKQDYGKEMLDRVNVYDDFIIEPNNSEYKKYVKTFYNLYAPFPHKSKEYDITDESKIEWSLNLMKHIFGRQFDLGLKYLKILYENPKQALPILVLTSEERQTGKSTLVDWLSIIFGGNMVVINPQDIGSSFNSSYATKNVIAIEESRFDSVQTTEKLKALATQKTLLVNTKYASPYNTPFYAKLIITSNDETKFSKVDEAEIRYWVRKVPSLKKGGNHNILEDLTKEIPYFLHYLSQLEDVDFSKSRQVFTAEEIGTSALEVVKSESKPELQKEIELLIEEYCANNVGEDVLRFTSTDIKDKWFNHNNNYSRNYISRILRDHMKLQKSDKVKRFTPTFDDASITKVGEYYTYTNPYSDQKKPSQETLDIDVNDAESVPF